MTNYFKIHSVGIVKKKGDRAYIEIYEQYQKALSGLDQFSHIIIITWFHRSDTKEKRNTLKVYPRRNMKNPLTGVFATRSPVRPNPLALSICRLLNVEGNIVNIKDIDSIDGTPVIDIKPYIPASDIMSNVKIPEWVEHGQEVVS
jgi:tRNA-Thr(GGU) m(6)t(6)A37 methyltransferase TsaA